MGERALNVALVTKLVHNGSQALEDGARLSFPRFLDFSSLCEASAILDELRAIESSDILPRLPLTAALQRQGMLSEFRPSLSGEELRRVALRLPEVLTRRMDMAYC